MSAKTKDSLNTTAKLAALQLISQAKWSEAVSFSADTGGMYLTVPLIDTGKTIFDNDQILKRVFVLRKKNKKIVESYVFELFGTKEQILTDGGLMLQNYGRKALQVTLSGNLTKYELTGEFIESIDYNN